MTNAQVRLIGAAIAMLAGGVIANATNIDVNVSIVIILVSAAIFLLNTCATRRISSPKAWRSRHPELGQI